MDTLRNRYIKAQVMALAPRFSQDGVGIQFDEEACDWVVIPKYPLPERWAQRWSPLLIVFPADYPSTPPPGFYLKHKLWSKPGRDTHLFRDATYHGAPDLSESGWSWYCVLARVGEAGGWSPNANDPNEPDNLWTFLNMVREALTDFDG